MTAHADLFGAITTEGLTVLRNVAMVVILGGGGTALLGMRMLRRRRLRWTWTLTLLPVAWLMWIVNKPLALLMAVAIGLAAWRGFKDETEAFQAGGDLQQEMLLRRGIRDVVQARDARKRVKRDGFVDADGLVLGDDEHRKPVRVPVGRRSGSHALVVGATGSGKTVTQAWIASRLIREGHACIAVDPKGDPLLRHTLKESAEAAGRHFVEWHPEGSLVYNPLARGTATERADKLLAGEEWSEPHYLRQAQRYLGHVLRVLEGTGTQVDIATVAAACDPSRLAALGDKLDNAGRQRLDDYLESLSAEQRRGLSGMRDRLAVLAESDLAPALVPAEGQTPISLDWVIQDRATCLFTLDADRRPLASQMISAAIVQDLITVAAARQHDPQPTLVVIDEFAALAAAHVTRLFGRGRSAGLSLLLGTQELADLTHADPALRDQVTGNLELLVAHRQNVPDSADLIARIAGTRGTWIHTERTGRPAKGQPAEAGTRTYGWEYRIHPDQLKRLPPGHAAVIAPTRARALITRIHHPDLHA